MALRFTGNFSLHSRHLYGQVYDVNKPSAGRPCRALLPPRPTSPGALMSMHLQPLTPVVLPSPSVPLSPPSHYPPPSITVSLLPQLPPTIRQVLVPLPVVLLLLPLVNNSLLSPISEASLPPVLLLIKRTCFLRLTSTNETYQCCLLLVNGMPIARLLLQCKTYHVVYHLIFCIIL